jgi:hypothetical protein
VQFIKSRSVIRKVATHAVQTLIDVGAFLLGIMLKLDAVVLMYDPLHTLSNSSSRVV